MDSVDNPGKSASSLGFNGKANSSLHLCNNLSAAFETESKCGFNVFTPFPA